MKKYVKLISLILAVLMMIFAIPVSASDGLADISGVSDGTKLISMKNLSDYANATKASEDITVEQAVAPSYVSVDSEGTYIANKKYGWHFLQSG